MHMDRRIVGLNQLTDILIDREACRLTERWTDRETDRWTDRLASRPTYIETKRYTDIKIHRAHGFTRYDTEYFKWTARQPDRWIDREMNGLADRQTPDIFTQTD
jgi:hypothetical protein